MRLYMKEKIDCNNCLNCVNAIIYENKIGTIFGVKFMNYGSNYVVYCKKLAHTMYKGDILNYTECMVGCSCFKKGRPTTREGVTP